MMPSSPDHQAFTFPFDVTVNGEVTRTVSARVPKVRDLLEVSKLGLHPADVEAEIAARVIGITREEFLDWPSAAFIQIHRWLVPLVDLNGVASDASS